jgi:glycosyltransferase involved in cell wall biosynthesis
VVFNALHPDEFAFQPEPVAADLTVEGKPLRLEPGYALFAGRMNREKGADLAVAMARAAGLPLVMAGPLAPRAWDPDYFDRVMRPLLAGPGVRYLGELGPADLERVYRGAAVLVNPVRWAEPFGLVAVEAMAHGVPVVASYHGAMPELVEAGVTGYLARGVKTGAARLRDAVAQIDRRRCFERARARFSWEVTGKTYLDIIWRALHESPL